MPGAFGLLDDQHHPRFPADFLVESRIRLDAFKLNRIGAFVEGTVTRLKWGNQGCRLARQTPDILVNGTHVLVTWDEHARPWFECPACGRRCKHVYNHLAARTPNISVNGTSVLVVWDSQGRPYFECGRCSKRVKHIYLPELMCRQCCGLDYSSRHIARSVPGIHRVMRWRRQIGIDPHPFAPIPKRKRHHTRYHRVVARILLEERALLGHLQTVTHDLERRARLRGMIPK